MYPRHSIVMRHSRLNEDVRTLAGLGSRAEPRGPALLAGVDRAPRAAHLGDGSVASPLVPDGRARRAAPVHVLHRRRR